MGTDAGHDALAERSRLRRERMVGHRAPSHADAEEWDLDFWQAQGPEARLSALAGFGSPYLLDPKDNGEILQLGVAPNRIDLLREASPLAFGPAWERRVESRYGRARACWVAIEDLLSIKERIDHPRHREDARVLRLVIARRRDAGRA